jgi:hypothetical protein
MVEPIPDIIPPPLLVVAGAGAAGRGAGADVDAARRAGAAGAERRAGARLERCESKKIAQVS